MINEIKGYKQKIGEDYFGFMSPSDYKTAAYLGTHGTQAAEGVPPLLARIPGMQAGGIVTKPTVAMLGEAGPEAVLPAAVTGFLGRHGLGSFAEGINRLRWGAAPAAGHTTHFSPSIVINGNADDSMISKLEIKLADIADRFIDNFASAQRQERRLSYESG